MKERSGKKKPVRKGKAPARKVRTRSRSANPAKAKSATSTPAKSKSSRSTTATRRKGSASRNKRQEPPKDEVLVLLSAAGYRPLNKVELSKQLHITEDERAGFTRHLKQLERNGLIARIKKDRYVLPGEADLIAGVIHVHPDGFAHVITDVADEQDIYISSGNRWTAMHKDRVLVRLERPSPHDMRRRGGRRSGGDGKEGKVIRILERANDTIVGTLQRTTKFFYVVSDDPRFTENVYVEPVCEASGKKARVGDKVVVRVAEWESRHVNPEGEIVEVLGAADAPGIDILSVLRKYHLPTSFPEKVTREAEGAAHDVTPEEIASREDWRGKEVITIDPDTARDFDDAFHVEKLKTGWRLGVHIADVSHYVRPGSELDREAYRRGNSVYLPDRVVPMLPEVLSNGICSLNPAVDRLTRLAVIDFDKNGKPTAVRFARSVIHSAARLTYKDAFKILQSPPETSVEKSVHRGWELAAILRKRRFENGSLDLDFPEVKVQVDDDGTPIAIEKVENDISHQLIEEFMLAANDAVGEQLKNAGRPVVYRVHEDPDESRLSEYREFVLSHGVQVGDLTNRRELTRLLARIKPLPEVYALKLGLLKSLQKARYDTTPLGHYGLAKPNYAHFTSPIRRYADLVVHRSLGAYIDALAGTPAPTGPGSKAAKAALSSTALTEVAEHISTTERTAIDAEREATKMKKLEFFALQLRSDRPQTFSAVVVDVRNFGLLVELTDILLTGLIHVSTLDDDFYTFDSARLQFVGRATRRTFAVGHRLQVTVDRVDTFKQQVDFRVAKDDPAPKPRRRRRR